MRRYPTKDAIDSLIKKLGLPEAAKHSQDWEHEVADSKRILEFVLCYENDILDEDEKFTLMIILIDSCNEALAEEGILDETLWARVKLCLIKDEKIHKDTIDYWILHDCDDVDDWFYITPFVREIYK